MTETHDTMPAPAYRGPSEPVTCDLCGGWCRAKEMALRCAITDRYGSAGDKGIPYVADICGGCASKPIGELIRYFWTPQPRTDLCGEGLCNHYPADEYRAADCPA